MASAAKAIAAVGRRMAAAEASRLAEREPAIVEKLVAHLPELRADLLSALEDAGPPAQQRSRRQRARVVRAVGGDVATRVHVTLCEEVAAAAAMVTGLARAIDVLVAGTGLDVPRVVTSVEEVAASLRAEASLDGDAGSRDGSASTARIASLLGIPEAERALHDHGNPGSELIERHLADASTQRTGLEAECSLTLGRLLLPIDDVIAFLASSE